ncbi:hypothetical protein PR048_001938 [Dryococelus australis]|uniref:Uncharacterized protein n=1 Tax=Dryococelus australis TaxID=614101 RepID=A0ABQ9IIW9_9NEOP|nr:hypothetical protein PR048_001938 [Dryococelus australis]
MQKETEIPTPEFAAVPKQNTNAAIAKEKDCVAATQVPSTFFEPAYQADERQGHFCIAADRRMMYPKQSQLKSLEIGTLVLVRITNISKTWGFITTKRLPLYCGTFVVSGRKKEICYHVSCPTTGDVVGNFNLRLLKKYNVPL